MVFNNFIFTVSDTLILNPLRCSNKFQRKHECAISEFPGTAEVCPNTQLIGPEEFVILLSIIFNLGTWVFCSVIILKGFQQECNTIFKINKIYWLTYVVFAASVA